VPSYYPIEDSLPRSGRRIGDQVASAGHHSSHGHGGGYGHYSGGGHHQSYHTQQYTAGNLDFISILGALAFASLLGAAILTLAQNNAAGNC